MTPIVFAQERGKVFEMYSSSTEMSLRIATYADMKGKEVVENGEFFCFVDRFDNSIKYDHQAYSCSESDMKNLFEGKIVVRVFVAEKFAHVNANLKMNSNISDCL